MISPETGLTISGSWQFAGARISQNELVLPAFRSVLSLFDEPVRIAELGTYEGGLTWLLHMIAHPHTHIWTFDNKQRVPECLLKMWGPKRIYQRIGDVFAEQGDSLIEILEDDKPVLLLCDNGNKVREVNMFAPYLKPGDVIMCHDYAETARVFKTEMKDRYWNHCEIRYDQISNTLESNGFMPILRERTLKAAWGCFMKQEE